MDEELIQRIRENYGDDIDVMDLLSRLRSADILAMTVDVLIERGLISSRSLVGDARLDYGDPWDYKSLSRNFLLSYKGGIEEVIRNLRE